VISSFGAIKADDNLSDVSCSFTSLVHGMFSFNSKYNRLENMGVSLLGQNGNQRVN